MIHGARRGTDRSEDAFRFVSHVKPAGVRFGDLAFRQEPANVVVRRDVKKFRLRAPRLWRPIFAAANARTEFAALSCTRPLGLVDHGATSLRIDRFEDVVIGEREGMQELELIVIAIQDPQIAVPTGVRRGLYEPAVDLRVDQERRRYFIPVPAVVRGVLVITLDLACLDIERDRRISKEIVARPIVSDPGRGIPGTPVGRVRTRIEDPRDPDRSTAAFVGVSYPGPSPWLVWCRYGVRLPNSF